jgi:hypothetical protein
MAALTSRRLRRLRPDQFDIAHPAAVDDELGDGCVSTCVAFWVKLGRAAQNQFTQTTTAPESRECQ